jgi:hypothetical protein
LKYANNSNHVQSTIEDNNICAMDENRTFMLKVFSFKACQLESFLPRTNVTNQVPNHHLFHPKGFPIEASRSSLLTPTKGPQTFLSTTVVDFFCTSNFSTITSSTKMKGTINKEEADKLAKE